MQKNKLVYIVCVVIVIALVSFTVFSRQSKKVEAPVLSDSTKTQMPVTTTDTTPAVDSTSSMPADSFTMATVASHNTQTNCWTTVNGSVYDVTSWISRHPGGSKAILGLCGKDGTDTFNGKHGGQARPESELASFKIGTLSK